MPKYTGMQNIQLAEARQPPRDPYTAQDANRILIGKKNST